MSAFSSQVQVWSGTEVKVPKGAFHLMLYTHRSAPAPGLARFFLVPPSHLTVAFAPCACLLCAQSDHTSWVRVLVLRLPLWEVRAWADEDRSFPLTHTLRPSVAPAGVSPQNDIAM